MVRSKTMTDKVNTYFIYISQQSHIVASIDTDRYDDAYTYLGTIECSVDDIISLIDFMQMAADATIINITQKMGKLFKDKQESNKDMN